MKKRKRISIDMNAVLYIFLVLVAIFLVYLIMHYHTIQSEGIIVKGEIQSVQRVWESDGEGGGSYQIHTRIKYSIDGVEYTDIVESYMGENGDFVEVLYMPTEPEHIYSLTELEIRLKVTKYVLVGWIVGWIAIMYIVDIAFKYSNKP